MSHAYVLQSAPLADLMERLSALWQSTRAGLSALVVAVLVLLVAWMLAVGLGAVVRLLLRGLGFNGAVRRTLGERWIGAHEPAAVVATAFRWLLLGVGVVLAIDVLGFDLSRALAARLAELLPRVLAAALVLLAGSAIAMLSGSIAHRFFLGARLRGARLRAQIVAGLITGFASLVALEQLGFAAQLLLGITLVAIGTAGLALALAVGLGCRDLARDFVIEYLKAIDDEPQTRP